MKVPLLDLRAQFETIKDDVLPALMEVVEAQRFIMGDQVRELEQRVAAVSNARFGIACASGTDALLLSLMTLNLQAGDEVVTTPFTFFATAGAIHNAGGTPVFVDIDPATFNFDLEQVAAAITPRTRAIVPVHIFGQMADMEGVMALAAQHDLAVIEDAAQAIGARRKIDGTWRLAGELGTTGAFSFFPSKNLGGWGDGGMIVTQDEALAERLRKLRTHGGAKQYYHDEIGINSRLDTIQAAVLLRKLVRLEKWSAARRERAGHYTAAFGDVDDVTSPVTDPANEHIYHQYTIRVPRRDELKQHLLGRGIGCAVYYPKALHLQPCFAALGYGEGAFPESERACREVLSLPVYPELSREQQDVVVETIGEFYR
ncbi:MAG: DegT/DnrJ/EryC1/StrS family aminotransferase [Gemmatimonadales bacterium]